MIRIFDTLSSLFWSRGAPFRASKSHILTFIDNGILRRTIWPMQLNRLSAVITCKDTCDSGGLD